MAINALKAQQWASLQTLVIRYQGLLDAPLDDPEREALRQHISRHLMGGVVRCLSLEDATDDPDPAAQFERQDSQMVRLIREELRHFRVQNGGAKGMAAVHGGEAEFAPMVAQVLVVGKQLEAERADIRRHVEERALAEALPGVVRVRPRTVTFISAMLRGYDGTGSLEGFMRTLVRSTLADIANTRQKEVKRQRSRKAVVPKGATPQEAARLQAIYEQRQALLGLEALPFEMLGAQRAEPADAKDADEEDVQDEEERVGATGNLSDEDLQLLNEALAALPPLERALVDQYLGREEPQQGKELAARFGCSPARVSQVKARLKAAWDVLEWGKPLPMTSAPAHIRPRRVI